MEKIEKNGWTYNYETHCTLRLEGCVIPLLARTVPLGQKRKRGAPAEAKKSAHSSIIFLICFFCSMY